MSKIDYVEYIEEHTLRCEASGRGGGIEIDAQFMFEYIDDAKMTAYQNYLGGGLLGAICSSNNFESEVKPEDRAKFEQLTVELKKYFHNLTNHEGDEWEEQSFEQNQHVPVSAY